MQITVENLKEIIGDKECQLFIVRQENNRLRQMLKVANDEIEKLSKKGKKRNANTGDIPNKQHEGLGG